MFAPALKPPRIFTIAKWMQRIGLRGGHRLESVAKNMGLLDRKVSYSLAHNVKFTVPLALRPYDRNFIEKYEVDAIKMISSRLSRATGPVTLIDCGADIGLMSCHIAAANNRISRIVAFEPNGRAYPYLKANLDQLPWQTTALNAAAADFEGQGELGRPEHDPHSEHACFLVPDADGSINVMKIDSLGLPAGTDLCLKIDVEGGELAVVEGAAQTLADANSFTILFEAHRQQVRRSGIDSSVIIRRLMDFGKLDVSIAEEPNKKIDWSRAFFDQVSGEIYNICVSNEPKSTASIDSRSGFE